MSDDEGNVVSEPLRFSPLSNTVAHSRRYVRSILCDLGRSELLESAELGVSELVTNAMLHARTAFHVSVRLMKSGDVRIEVTDFSDVHARLRPAQLMASTGRGMRLVASLSQRWDITPLENGPGKTVWFEPRETMTDMGFCADDWAADIAELM